MEYNLIACINRKNALGEKNDLLYHIKDDLINFKKITNSNVVIMGRKTFESLPNKKPLSNRINIIITSNKNYKQDGCNIVHSIEECIDLCNKQYSNTPCFVIGGSQIYNEFLKKDLIKKAYITEVDDSQDGDTYLNCNFHNNKEWELIQSCGFITDEKTHLKYQFNVYQKI